MGSTPTSGTNKTMKKPTIRRPYQPKKKQAEHLLNGEIRHPQVRITGDDIGETRVVAIQEAQRLANDLGLDLVEISATAKPPVCRICDYSKFMYDLNKRRKASKHQAKSDTKEMRLTYTTDEHDVAFKVRHATNWLQNGDKVRCVIRFHGRTIQFKDQGEILLLRVSQMLEEFGKIESFPKLEGKFMSMTIVPKKVHAEKEKQNEQIQRT